MFSLVILLKYTQMTIAISNCATWLHGRFREYRPKQPRRKRRFRNADSILAEIKKRSG